MKRFLVFGALLGWCMLLLGVRIARSNAFYFFFLSWNLFLAAVPYGAAVVLETLDRSRRHGAMQWTAFVIWLLFLPNAPYIITDFIHLRPRPPIPLWYDMLLLLSSAGTGVLLGYGSMLIVQRVIARRFGKRQGWLLAVLTMMLSAFGIYLGRFLRFNSWDAFTDPLPLFADIAQRLMNPMAHPKTFAVTLLFGMALTLGYIALHVIAEDTREA
ncbi:MAG TPA: DUF1361 domain-containing protein [Thermoanaerobaculia bacterium]